MAKYLLIGLLAVLVAGEESKRTGRQLFYHGPHQLLPIQYYFINKVQTGPIADPGLLTSLSLKKVYFTLIYLCRTIPGDSEPTLS